MCPRPENHPGAKSREGLFLRQSLLYHGFVKRHDVLQFALASAAGVVAYHLWTSQHLAIGPDGLMLAFQNITDSLGDWVHRLRAALR